MRRLVHFLRATPLHPQWLMRGDEFKTDVLRRRATGKVLDIGCSTRWAERHIPADCVYIGLDYPATGMTMYASRPDVFADARKLPFADESVDTIILFETLEHVADPMVAISEAFRVLNPRGCLMLTVPFLYPLHDEPFDFTRFTCHGLRNALEQSGFQVEEMRPSLTSAETAGLVASLALGGMTLEAIKNRSPSMLLSPFLLLAIPLLNLFFWTLGKLMPSWNAVPAGYHVLARK